MTELFGLAGSSALNRQLVFQRGLKRRLDLAVLDGHDVQGLLHFFHQTQVGGKWQVIQQRLPGLRRRRVRD